LYDRDGASSHTKASSKREDAGLTGYGINPKAVVKWEKRAFVGHAPMGPKIVHSSVLVSEKKAIIVFLVNKRSWCWIIVSKGCKLPFHL
jgi:hypothetical protein